MPKKATTDHGEIIHFAGRRRLFPVASRADARQIRLASREDVKEEETRIGWPAYFRPFIDGRLVFLYDEADVEPMSSGVSHCPDLAAPPSASASAIRRRAGSADTTSTSTSSPIE